MNYLEFIKENKNNKENKDATLNIFKTVNINESNKMIINLIKKEINEKYVESLGKYDTKIGKDHCISELFVTSDPSNICFSFNWLPSAKSPEIYSISFYENMDPFFYGTGKTALTINTMGCPIPYIVPLMTYVLNTKDLALTEANSNKLLTKKFSNVKETNEMYIGALKYQLYENLDESKLTNIFNYNISHNVFESSFNDIEKFADQSEDWTPYLINSINGCYDDVITAKKGGKSSISEVEVGINKKQSIVVGLNDSERKIDEQLQSSLKMYTKDINILNLLKDRLAFLNPDTICLESKQKAFNYLVDWTSSQDKAKITIKMVTTCAKAFEAAKNNTEFKDEDVIQLLERQMNKIKIKKG